MLVTVDNEKYVISFRHEYSEEPGNSTNIEKTTCYLKKNKEILCEASVVKHIEDKSNLIYARKVVITKILDKIGFPKETRTKFWDQIWKQMRK